LPRDVSPATSRPRRPDGLFRRGRIPRRHHHRSLAHLRAAWLFVVRASAGFYAAIIAFTFSRNFYLSGLLLSVAGYCHDHLRGHYHSLLQHLLKTICATRDEHLFHGVSRTAPIGCLIAGSMAHLIGAPLAIAGMSTPGAGWKPGRILEGKG